LASAGIACPREMVVNLLDTQIALVEANEGIAIIPSFGLPVARNRKVTMTQLNPVVHLEFHQINDRAKPLSPRNRIRTFGHWLRIWATMRATSFTAPSAASRFARRSLDASRWRPQKI